MPPIPTPETSLIMQPVSTSSLVPGIAPDQLQIGDYVIGGGDCPQLYGHPDIRY